MATSADRAHPGSGEPPAPDAAGPACPAVTEDDAAIRAALADASFPTLLAVLIHLTGDLSILHGDIRPQPQTLGDEQGGITLEQQERIKDRAVAAIAAYRDGGCRPPPPLGEDTILAIMSFLAGEPMPADYIEMMREEMRVTPGDPRRLVWSDPAYAQAAQAFRVAIIGAGLSGTVAAIRLGQAGIPYVLIEKNPDLGGTWFENVYPGCRVDNPGHFYSYSFEQTLDWTHSFPKQAEVLDYVRACGDRYGVRDHTRFSTEVEAATFDEATALWTLRLRRAEGTNEEITANAVVSAVGQLNRPRLPDIPGIGSFGATILHTGAWDGSVPLAGKRIGVIGTGASAFQLVPEIAGAAAHLTVFQRSAPWIYPTPHYHEEVPAGHRWLLKHVPYYANWYRFWLFWTLADGLLPMVTVDPDWPDTRMAVNAANEQARQNLTATIREQLAGRPDLIEKCVPTYPVLGKRVLRDNGNWYRTLRRDNVDLVVSPIERLVPGGVELADGTTVALDVLVMATGFQASKFFFPMEIRGPGGRTIDDVWQGDARAFLSVTVPTLPNFFCLYGPNANIVHGGSMIFMSECGVRFVTESIRLLVEQGHRSMEPTPEAHASYNREIDAANAARTWGVPTVSSWYKNRKGRVSQVWPLRFSEYWLKTRAPDPADFILR